MRTVADGQRTMKAAVRLAIIGTCLSWTVIPVLVAAAPRVQVTTYPAAPPPKGAHLAITSLVATFPGFKEEDSVYLGWADVVRDALAASLEARGYTVIPAAEVREAIGFYSCWEPVVRHSGAHGDGWFFGVDEETGNATAPARTVAGAAGLDARCAVERGSPRNVARAVGADYAVTATVVYDGYGCPDRCRLDVHKIDLRINGGGRKDSGFLIVEPELDIADKMAPPGPEAWTRLLQDAMTAAGWGPESP